MIPEDASEFGPVVVLAAHYDSRDRAERDQDPNMTDLPIQGANDGASGVAVLWELARILPEMNLDHEVWILLTDAEDQGPTPSMLGAAAWAENRTDQDIARIDAFLLVDMIGDADLKIHRTYPPYLGDPEGDRLWDSVESLSQPLGLIDNVTGCDGNPGQDIVNFSKTDGDDIRDTPLSCLRARWRIYVPRVLRKPWQTLGNSWEAQQKSCFDALGA